MKKQLFLLLLIIASGLDAIPRRVATAEKKDGHEKGRFTLNSKAFFHRGKIPSLYTCDGKDYSPELNWTNPPTGTRSFVVVFHDPDALGGPWNHWIVINIPGNYDHLDERVDAAAIGAIVCTNSWDEQKYSGPCPPLKEHRYIFTLYALDIPKLPLKADAHRKDVIAAMQGHVLGQARLLGRYQRISESKS